MSVNILIFNGHEFKDFRTETSQQCIFWSVVSEGIKKKF